MMYNFNFNQQVELIITSSPYSRKVADPTPFGRVGGKGRVLSRLVDTLNHYENT